MARKASAFRDSPYCGVPSWDNKLPGAQLSMILSVLSISLHEEASSKAKKPKVVLRLLQDERLIKKKKLRNQKMVLQLIHQKPLTLDLYGIGGELILRGGWMI
ncbi:hypothetical protein YC2023_009348 [Brassica napus]